MDESDEVFRGFVASLLAFSARLQNVRAGFATILRLSPIQYTILVAIGHMEATDDVNVGLIAEHLHLSGAFVTIESGKLAKLGLIEKRRDTKDRRKVRLITTKKGWELIESLAPVQRHVNDVLFGCFTAAQFKDLCNLAPKLVHTADQALRLVYYYAEDRALV